MTSKDEADIPHSSAGLIVEPADANAEKEQFKAELDRTLQETERAIFDIKNIEFSDAELQSWTRAREIVGRFRPVPWFIWRISNYVLGKPGQINEVSEGLVFGLRRLLFAAASDPILGAGRKVNSMRVALDVLPPDVVAAVSVLHAVSRRLVGFDFERIWRPILDDALLRARVGMIVGMRAPSFGPGRGMLAGFAGRGGLAILIATGTLDEARAALELLASGLTIKEVGITVYRCDPLQVSAMTLSASGCGRDAAFGTVNYSVAGTGVPELENQEQLRWLGAFTICEGIRVGNTALVPELYWSLFNFELPDGPPALAEEFKKIVRRGHAWQWMV